MFPATQRDDVSRHELDVCVDFDTAAYELEYRDCLALEQRGLECGDGFLELSDEPGAGSD